MPKMQINFWYINNSIEAIVKIKIKLGYYCLYRSHIDWKYQVHFPVSSFHNSQRVTFHQKLPSGRINSEKIWCWIFNNSHLCLSTRRFHFEGRNPSMKWYIGYKSVRTIETKQWKRGNATNYFRFHGRFCAVHSSKRPFSITKLFPRH